MAKRLSETLRAREALVPQREIGRGICRNCGGAIVVDPDDFRSPHLPHRRICRKCGAEYGTTKPR
jgi:ribosomal protein L40E